MRFTPPFPHISSKAALPLLIAAALAMALLMLALAAPIPAGAQTGDTPTPEPTDTTAPADTPTPEPEDERADKTPKPDNEESDPEGKLPIEPVVDEPRQVSAPLSNAVPANFLIQTDYDVDNDGLIEISYLEQLNAIRWDLNGSGVSDSSSDARNYRSAFPIAAASMGCPSSGCRGYELTRSLDFDNPASYASRSVNTDWTQGEGWLPIGYGTSSSSRIFWAIFDGNSYTISNLYIDTGGPNVGLFAVNTGSIVRIGLIEIDVTTDGAQQGGLVGWNEGLIAHSYATGSVTGGFTNVGGLVGYSGGVIAYCYANVDVVGGYETGGLVGDNHTAVVSSYATGSVSGTTEVGGLVGDNEGGVIIYSYSTGRVTGSSPIGGFVGDNHSSLIRASYSDTQTSGQSAGVGTGPSDGIEGKTSVDLKLPTWYHGIYSDWHHAGDVWDFGTSAQYPTLKPGLELYLDVCEQSISAIGRVGIIGEWADDCLSTNRSGRYARFYTFTLNTASEVTINLMSNYYSDVDTYLYLLEGAGRHGRVIEWDNNDGYDSNSRITRRLQPGTYTIEATTLRSSITSFFGLILDGVPLATPPPPFGLSTDASRSNASIVTVEAGQSFDLTARMHSVGGAGEHGGVSVSFPQLDDDGESGNSYTSPVADVKVITAQTTVANVRFYRARDDRYNRIYYSDDPNNARLAQHLLVESDNQSWSQGNDRTLKLRITPKQEGEIRMLVRGWICADEYANCSRQPSSGGTPDQQGWPAREVIIRVTPVEPPELRANLLSCGVGDRDPHLGHYQTGDIVRLSARVWNHVGAPGPGANLYVRFTFFDKDVKRIGELTTAPRYIALNLTDEFAFRVPANEIHDSVIYLPRGANTVVCDLVWHQSTISGFNHILQDSTGRGDGGISNGSVTVADTPLHAQRLINSREIKRGTAEWVLDASISPPFGQSDTQNLIVTLERQSLPVFESLSRSFTTFTLTVPETTWVDYGEITKWIASDGRYDRYNHSAEKAQYQQSLAGDALRGFAGFFFSVYSLFQSIFGFGFDLENPLDGASKHNCADEAIITTLQPIRFNNDKIPKQLQVEIPLKSLNEDDYISLTVENSLDLLSLEVIEEETFDDLLQSGGAPSCEPPPNGTSPHPTPVPTPTPPADSCVVTLTDAGTTRGTWTDECVSENTPTEPTYPPSGTRYARFYTFTLDARSDVTIDLTSTTDTYMYLMEGLGKSGTVLHENDDVDFTGGNSNSRISETLDAGDYTIEATTYNLEATGNFELSLTIE